MSDKSSAPTPLLEKQSSTIPQASQVGQQAALEAVFIASEVALPCFAEWTLLILSQCSCCLQIPVYMIYFL